MLKRYAFATKPPTLPSGKTCILEKQITDFAFSPKTTIAARDAKLQGQPAAMPPLPYFDLFHRVLTLGEKFPPTLRLMN